MAIMPTLAKGDLDALARVTWAESRGQPWLGQCAITWVVLNRLAREKGRFPRTVQGIIYQPYQFSCFNRNDPQCEKVKVVTEADPAFVEAMAAVTAVLTGKVPDPTNGSDHYHHIAMKPYPAWASKLYPQATIGAHKFYREIAPE
jgi:N-acetylmuramoyl-L-alanine amidase